MKLRTFILLLLITALFAGCSSSQNSGGAADMKLLYYTKNNLQNTEASVEVKDSRLILKFKSSFRDKINNIEYSITNAESETLYRYLKQVKFNSLVPPKPELITDAPEEYISAEYDGASNKYDMTARRNLPSDITGLRNKIFSLIEKYDSNWKQEAGL